MPWSNLLWSNSKKTQKMKKLFPFKIDSSGSQNPHIGKVFTIGRFSVTVEDVIAEGKNVVESRFKARGRVTTTFSWHSISGICRSCLLEIVKVWDDLLIVVWLKCLHRLVFHFGEPFCLVRVLCIKWIKKTKTSSEHDQYYQLTYWPFPSFSRNPAFNYGKLLYRQTALFLHFK